MAHNNYLKSHFDELFGVVPSPGAEWRMMDTPMTQEDHQGHLQILKAEGDIKIVRREMCGAVWVTQPQYADDMQDIARERGEDPEEALIDLGQTALHQFL